MGTLKINYAEFDTSNIQTITDLIEKFYIVIKFKKDGTISYINENGLNTFGYSENEILGKHHRQLCYLSYTKTKKYEDFWVNLNNGFVEREVYCLKDVNNNNVFLDGNYLLQNFDGEDMYVFFAKDITADYKKILKMQKLLRPLMRKESTLNST